MSPAPRREPGYKGAVRIPPLVGWRLAVILLGYAAATLLVQALDGGLAGEPRPLGGSHFAFGLVLAMTVMPGPLLGLFVTPASGERLRGLAVGGCGVTAFVALLGGIYLGKRLGGEGPAGAGAWVAIAWCALALPLAGVDFLRLRRGDPPPG